MAVRVVRSGQILNIHYSYIANGLDKQCERERGEASMLQGTGLSNCECFYSESNSTLNWATFKVISMRTGTTSVLQLLIPEA